MNIRLIEHGKDYIQPFRGHDSDVGLDAPVPCSGVLKPGPNVIGLGYGLEVPVGYNVAVYPRTGMVSGKASLDMKVANSTYSVKEIHQQGVCIDAKNPPIDPHYTGEIHMIVVNHSVLNIEYEKGTRFGQLVCHPITYITPVVSTDKTRGSGWAGSTGVV